jgi:cytochrome c
MKLIKYLIPCVLISIASAQRAGDRQPVAGAHPSYTVTDIRPSSGTTAAAGTPWPATGGALAFPIGGMDFMSDGRLVVTSWRDPYEVFIVSKEIVGSNPKSATVTKFATGLVEALGVKVVNDSIYVLEKDQVTLLLDNDHDGTADEYRAIAYDWTKSVNSKEYAMGLPYDGTWFYAAFGDPTVSSGTSIDPVPAGRHNGVLRVRRSDGALEVFSGGLRVPGGFSMVYGQPWVAEIQGGYRPSSVVYNPKAGRWYGRPVNPPSMFQPTSRAMNPTNVKFPYSSPEDMFSLATPFVLNIPFKNTSASGAGPIGWQRSTAQFVEIKSGVYAGQLLIAESDNGESGSGVMVRAYVEQTADGEYQGAVFQFARNTVFGGTSTPSGFSKNACFALVTGPDGNFYCGANGATSAGWTRNTSVGLDRISVSGAAAPFEMLAVRSTGANTFEFEFTKPLATSLGNDVTANIAVQKWWDRLSENYGCCRIGAASTTSTATTGSVATVQVTSATVQADRKKVVVTFPAGQLTAHWQYYFRWTDAMKTDANETLYGTEAFYTLNAFGPASAAVAIENYRTSAGKDPFTLSAIPGGMVRLNLILSQDAPYKVWVTNLKGEVRATRQGRGSEQILFQPSELSSGMSVVRVQAGNQTYSRLISTR